MPSTSTPAGVCEPGGCMVEQYFAGGDPCLCASACPDECLVGCPLSGRLFLCLQSSDNDKGSRATSSG